MNFEVNGFNFNGVPNGNYRLVPVYSEVLDAKTQKSGEWVCVNGTNEMQVQLSDNEVTIETNNPKDDVVMEKVPTLLSPFYEDSGNYAAFSLTLYNSGREEVRGDLVMTLKDKETGEEFNGFLLTPNVVAQRLGSTSFAIKMLSQYYNSGRIGTLRTGKYDVTFSIKANRKGVEKLIPITMKEPFEVEVLPNNHEGTIEFSYVDFLVNGKEVNYSTFDLNKTAEIGLQVQSRVRGYGLRNGYHGNIYYRLLDLTTNTWVDLDAVHHVYLPCEQPNDKAQTRLTFPTSKLEANHSYEVHIEIDRNGKRVDVWNPLALRHVFHIINESTSTDIKAYEHNKPNHQHIVNLQGVRQTKAWDSLPPGIYIVDGKKMLKK
jgi:peptidase C10 family protein